jgi:hypothetical protein
MSACPICNGYGEYEDEKTESGWRKCRYCKAGNVSPSERKKLMARFEITHTVVEGER